MFRHSLEEWAGNTVEHFGDQLDELDCRFQVMVQGLIQRMSDDEPSRQLRDQYVVTRGFLQASDRNEKANRFVQDVCRFFEGFDKTREWSGEVRHHLQGCSESQLRQATVETLADAFGLSRTHFSRKFQQETHQSVHDAVTSEKLSRAFSLLQAGVNVNDVRQRLGFGKEDHFREVFKRRYGILPSHVVEDPSEV